MTKDLAQDADIASYLKRYCEAYRKEYQQFTADPPRGGGFPAYPVSPYLGGTNLRCIVATDGVIIFHGNFPPDNQWWIAGGSALKVDYEPTVTPPEVTSLLKREGIYGKPMGIYRVVSKEKLSDDVWKGNLGSASSKLTVKIDRDQEIEVETYPLTLEECLARLTYGAFCHVLDIHLPQQSADFWTPHIIQNLGFVPADLNSRSYYNYIEILRHREMSAWDPRTAKIRVKADVRRDFAHYVTGESEGGTLSFGDSQWTENFNVSLAKIGEAIEGFESLLRYQGNAVEEVFHSYLKQNNILLDVYGECESKPRFHYPKGKTSPIGKSYVEPDFLIKYANQSYKLVEIERASKGVATKRGHARQDFGQAAFQTGEWKHFIKNHFQEISDRYPGIASKHTTCVIMSRSTEKSFGAYVDMKSYMELIQETYSVDEVFTYDDLLERAKAVYAKLGSLGI